MRQRKRHTLLRRMRCEFSERARYTVKKTANTQVLAVFFVNTQQSKAVRLNCFVIKNQR